MPRRGRRPGTAPGYTLVELIVVLTLVGILLAVALPRLAGTRAYQAEGFHAEALAAVRYGHKLALASGCPVRVTFAANGYALHQRQGCSGGAYVPVEHPARAGAFAASLPATVATVGDAQFLFDRLGRPADPGSGQPIAAGSDPNLAITVGGRTIRVEPETGYAR